MGKYSYGKGRRKDVEEFTTWQWLMLVGVTSGILVAFAVLWMLGYLKSTVR
jgi:predicted Co/Zn/Cd cation transporter (cation efflux family)